MNQSNNNFFTSLRNTSFRRMPNGWLGGVAAGLSHKYGWDIALVRGVLVVIGIFSFSTASLAYLVAWLLLPAAESERIEAEEILNGRIDSQNMGLIIATVCSLFFYSFSFAILLPFAVPFFIGGDTFGTGLIPLLLLGVGAIIFFNIKSSGDKSPTAPDSPTASVSPEAPISPAVPLSPEAPVSLAPTQQIPAQFNTPTTPTVPQFAAPAQQLPLVAPVLPPVVPVPEKRWGSGPGVPTFLALAGLLMLVFTGMLSYCAVYNVSMPPYFGAIFLGTAFILTGLTLAVLALRGRRGTWLTLLSILALFFIIPMADIALNYR